MENRFECHIRMLIDRIKMLLIESFICDGHDLWRHAIRDGCVFARKRRFDGIKCKHWQWMRINQPQVEQETFRAKSFPKCNDLENENNDGIVPNDT